MANKRPKPEEIVSKLRQVEVLMGQGMPHLDAIRQIGVVEQTYCGPQIKKRFHLQPNHIGSTSTTKAIFTWAIPLSNAAAPPALKPILGLLLHPPITVRTQHYPPREFAYLF